MFMPKNMPLREAAEFPLTHICKYFSITVYPKSKYGKTIIYFQADPQFVYTKNLDQITSILKNDLPRVLNTKCFNNERIPFSEEVKNTELGHLFEHILIQNLCDLRQSSPLDNKSYSGETSWNWDKYSYGSFHISISADESDDDIFPKALEKSLTLTEKILSSAMIDAGTGSSKLPVLKTLKV
jgi:hypothetical protein